MAAGLRRHDGGWCAARGVHVWYNPGGSTKPADLAGLIVGIYLDGYVNQPIAALR